MISANFEPLRILRIPQNSSEFPQNSPRILRIMLRILVTY